ncbi:MAG: VanZ family protein [Bacteroidales bacterium]|jgi:glycopeptide antibiotics resistance protein|nr:VanZ family protein [Bacteroidales bacterium]
MPHLSSLISQISSLKKPIFYAYLLAIIALIALPLNTSSELNDITILQLRGDYFFHILMFLPWAFFSGVYNMKKLYWVLIGLLFATLAECVQYLIPYRAFNINDLMANLLGVGIAWLLASVGRPWLKQFHTN